MQADVRLRMLKVKTFTETSLSTLETSIDTWLEARGEEELVHVQYEIDGTNYTCIIFYTEG